MEKSIIEFTFVGLFCCRLEKSGKIGKLSAKQLIRIISNEDGKGMSLLFVYPQGCQHQWVHNRQELL
jgi:hypothetical protein